MNSMRKWVGLFVALAFAAFALPSSAAQPAKIFSLNMSPVTVNSTTADLTAKYSNQTPNGNSVINTVILSPEVGVTINSTSFTNGGNQVSCPATTVNSAGQTVAVPPNSICVANIPSVMKAGCSPTACSWSFSLNVTLPNACTTKTWAGQAFAGNSFNGDVFAFQSSLSSVTTTIGTQCPHTITSTSSGPTGSGSIAPAGATTVAWDGSQSYTITANTGFYIADVKVDGTSVGKVASYAFTNVKADHTIAATFAANALSITSAPTSAVAGTPFDVTIGSTPAGATITFEPGCTATATKSADGTTFTITIDPLPTTGTCTMTFTAPGYLSASLTNFKVYKGVLDCFDYDSKLGPTNHLYDPDLPSTISGLGSSYVGTPGWGLRRGPNKDGAACVPVNYSCDLDATTNVATCTFDKDSGQLATFKYLFLWGPRAPQANGWTDYRPQVSWNITNPSATPTLPDWVPLLACLSDLFPALPTLPTTILPVIPSVSPFTDTANLPVNGGHAWYQPGQTALVCGGQQGWTAVGGPGNPLLQIWNIIIDEADLKVSGP
jgi:hypothetical protein